MNLLYLKYACEVERLGSINKAANYLMISQPYLSSCIRQLEQSINMMLFKRDSRGAIPTERGREFLQMAKVLLEQADLLSKYTQNGERDIDLQIASIRTAVSMTAYLEYLKQNIKTDSTFESNYYETRFDEIIEGVYQRVFSVGLLMYYGEQKSFIENYVNIRQLHFEETGSVPLCVILSGNSPLAGKEEISAEDVKNMIYVTYSDFKYSILDLQNECQLLNMNVPKKLIYVQDRHSLLNLLSSTNSFALAHRFKKEDEKRFNLVSVPSVEKECKVYFGYVIPKEIEFGKKKRIEEFLKIYREVIKMFI